MYSGSEALTRTEKSAFVRLLKMRKRNIPISSLPVLVLLHWDIGNDGEAQRACAAEAADGRGDARYLHSPDYPRKSAINPIKDDESVGTMRLKATLHTQKMIND